MQVFEHTVIAYWKAVSLMGAPKPSSTWDTLPLRCSTRISSLVLQLLHLLKRRFFPLVTGLLFHCFAKFTDTLADEQELGILVVQELGLKRHPSEATELFKYPTIGDSQ